MRKTKKKTKKLSSKAKKYLVNRYIILSERAQFFTHEIDSTQRKIDEIYNELDLVVKQLGGVVEVARQLPE
jgi:hypothetical protein